ncbi:hypothetical protein PPERSA_01655 [Pseudocohnilembus persalinus]|uniref:Sperm-tail PG-rich repeat n=1 Tax=Pseudocohnilembus persalinus TaxID=266149 RepID=A0A0V0R0Q8_PSEPJ|nr:hypothetical protein PPERSA_01655 [Pseudocohnilembus persalinus]|eukprot:KRX08110.1 hypothetical protein PPERSA_01655 [Pseudocohnilembus persalinus]
MVSAYSIGTAKRGDLSSSQKFVPGPGAYNADKKQKIQPPQWKIGSSQRGKMNLNNTVGPGSYEIKGKVGNEGAKYSMAVKNISKSNIFVPGPGAYNPKNNSDSTKQNPRKFSMGVKTSQSFFDVRKTPGPGSYENKSTVLNRPSSRIGNSKRPPLSDIDKSVPGPGTYSQQRPGSALTKYVDSRYKDGPMFGFGSETRKGLYHRRQTPGPGTYPIKSTLVYDKGTTMVSRKNLDHQNKVPGPGAYNPEKKQKQQPPSYRIGSGHRQDLSKSWAVPGPGTYQSSLYTKPKAPGYKIGSDIRRPLSGMSQTPGVGSYNPNVGKNAPKFSFGLITQGGFDMNTRKGQPGPGAYEPTVSQTKLRPSSAKIGTSTRPQLRNSGWVPGPGMYNIQGNSKGPKWGIGSSDRSKMQNNGVPGVGSYNIKPMFADVPAYLMPNKTSRI